MIEPRAVQDSTSQIGLSNALNMKQFLRSYGVILAMVAVIGFFAIKCPSFLTPQNFIVILREISIIVIISMGASLVFMAKGIDMTVGQVVGLSGVICARFLAAGHSPELSIVTALLCGLAFGATNGYLVAKIGVSPIVASLGLLLVVKSAEYLCSEGGYPYYLLTLSGPEAERFFFLGQGLIGPVPTSVVIMVAVVIATYVLVSQTKFGRYMYAIGENVRAAHLSGVKVRFYYGLAYALSGLTAALGGVIVTSRICAGIPGGGEGYLISMLATCLLSCAILGEGEVNVEGAVVAGVFMGILRNGLALLNVSAYYVDFLTGVLILTSVGIGNLRRLISLTSR